MLTYIQILINFIHFRNIIVKYEKINDSVKAYEFFKSEKNQYNIEYVPTKHNSDELYNF